MPGISHSADRSRPDLVVVGDVMVDVSVEAGSLAEGGDVHGEVRIHPAGAGANAAVWAAAEGAKTRLFARVGADLPGRLVAEALVARGVDARLTVDPGARTGAMLVVRGKGDRSMVADRGANARLSVDDLPDPLAAGAVLVSGYLLFHPGSEEAGIGAMSRARASFVAIDAASWPLAAAYGRDRFESAAACANVLLANEREAEALAGSSGEAAWRDLLRAFDLVVVKRGRRGAVALRSSGVVEASAPPAELVDATGAGDAFDGAFLAALAGGASTKAALQSGCRAGSGAIGTIDTWPPEPPA
jgi:sugar/nucleoside kinase (ribokinase family)